LGILVENNIYEKNNMSFEFGNGYGCYCELDNPSLPTVRKSISIQSMKDRRYLHEEDSDVDDKTESEYQKNKKAWFIVGIYSITVSVLLFEYLVFFVAKR